MQQGVVEMKTIKTARDTAQRVVKNAVDMRYDWINLFMRAGIAFLAIYSLLGISLSGIVLFLCAEAYFLWCARRLLRNHDDHHHESFHRHSGWAIKLLQWSTVENVLAGGLIGLCLAWLYSSAVHAIFGQAPEVYENIAPTTAWIIFTSYILSLVSCVLFDWKHVCSSAEHEGRQKTLYKIHAAQRNSALLAFLSVLALCSLLSSMKLL